MRIIGGSAKGKHLAGFTGRAIRPTPDRVREALFSILFTRLGSLSGLRVLDLYAGTGAMGLEALSRGAATALLIDKGPQSARLIPDNLRACAMEARGSFRRGNVLQVLTSLGPSPFDLIFLDPPYGQGLVEQTLSLIDSRGLLAVGGVICAESERHSGIPAAIGSLSRIDERSYGSTAVHLFSHSDPEVP